MISGIQIKDMDTAALAATAIKEKGVETVILTLGNKGALVLHEGIFTTIAALSVDAVDTTAAGDVFNGALAVALSEGKSVTDATSFACKAAAISVTRMGAQASAPFRREADEFVAARKATV